jgi:hypothetical protein
MLGFKVGICKILTFDIQCGFARQIIALANDAGVPAAIGRLGVLDDKGEQVLVLCHGVFFAFVAFLRGGERYQGH